MKTMFRTNGYTIKEVQVSRTTEKFVVFAEGGREAKRSDYQNWFDTWDEAKQFLVAYKAREVEKAESRLEYALSELAKVKALTQDIEED